MVTEHSNTVYNCAGCGQPIYYKGTTVYSPSGWHHFGSVTLCTGLVPVAVNLPLPRVTAHHYA